MENLLHKQSTTKHYPVYLLQEVIPEINKNIFQSARACNSSICKRVFDIFFSILLFLFIFSWLFPIIALAIKLNSKGPVFFKQLRHGVLERDIIVFKFRTMVSNAPVLNKDGKFLQAVKNDQRITRVGAFLRKTSLDELPQFWNVLLGNMSIVGPRPHIEQLKDHFDEDIQNYYIRTLVKPGITGLAQVRGLRGGTEIHHVMQDRINADAEYVSNWNFWMDIKIVIYTFIGIISGQDNAY